MKNLICFLSAFQILNFSAQEFVIETPDMLVLYEGIPMELKVGATGDYREVRMSVESPFTAPIGSAGSTITITTIATVGKGEKVFLGAKKFSVKKAPKPELTWNGISDGGRANKGAGSLSCRYGNNVPFSPSKGYFTILNYSITLDGVKGSLDGVGSSISSSHLNAIKEIKGGKIIIQVRVSGAYEGLVSASFN